MAALETVRGTLCGATVVTSQENAERLGAQFDPEKQAPAKKATSSKPSTTTK